MFGLGKHPWAVISAAFSLAVVMVGAYMKVEGVYNGILAAIDAQADQTRAVQAALDRMTEAIRTQTLEEANRGEQEKARDEILIELDKEQTERLNDTMESLKGHIAVLSNLTSGLYRHRLDLPPDP